MFLLCIVYSLKSLTISRHKPDITAESDDIFSNYEART